MSATGPHTGSGTLKQFDVVTLLRVPPLDAESFLRTNRRLPRVGDVGTILEIYTHPHLAYDIECCARGSHETAWEHAFDEGELRSFFWPYVADLPH